MGSSLQKKQSLNLQKTATPVMPSMHLGGPLNIVMQGQTYSTAYLNNTVAPNSNAL